MGWIGVKVFLSAAFEQGPFGPFTADAKCPSFRASYHNARWVSVTAAFQRSIQCLRRSAKVLSRLSLSGQHAGVQRFDISAESNRGTLRSRINADGVVRVGQDRENEVVCTHESSFCDAGRTRAADGFLSTETSPFRTSSLRQVTRCVNCSGWSADCRCNVSLITTCVSLMMILMSAP
jgi:hypothetical protein